MTDAPIDYVALAKRAVIDEKLLATAQSLWRLHAPEAMARNHERIPGYLRTSDAGRCSRELWAQVHDRYDMPENAEDLLLKMNQGTLSGAWLACLIAAGLNSEGYGVHLEAEITVNSDPPRTGHADIAVYAPGGLRSTVHGVANSLNVFPALEVVDCKWSAWPFGIDAPDVKARYQCISTGAYAAQLGAPNFVILTSAPAAKGEKMKQFRYDTDDWLMDIAMEYDRLSRALKDETPEGDPQDAWRCKKCRAGWCERNANPMRPVTHSIEVLS